MDLKRTILIPVVLCLAVLPGHAQPTDAQRRYANNLTLESKLLFSWRHTSNPETAIQLAQVREKLAKWPEAIATWKFIRTRWAHVRRLDGSPLYVTTYGQTADYYIYRVQRRQKYPQRRYARSHEQRPRRMRAAIDRFHQTVRGDSAFSGPADFDGDGVEEMFFTSLFKPKGKTNYLGTVGIAKWTGTSFRMIWELSGSMSGQSGLDDLDDDGWWEGYIRDGRDINKVHRFGFNGKTVCFLDIKQSPPKKLPPTPNPDF